MHNLASFTSYVKADLTRYCGKVSIGQFVRRYFLTPEFCYTFWMRATAATRRVPLALPLHVLCRLNLRRLGHKFGINIPYNTKIGPGLYIGHFGGIVVTPKAIIGSNCNLSCGVVIGETFRGKRPGVPMIGNKVYIAPGAKVIGGITIGNDVAIGANCVVTKDIPDNAVVAGVPGQIISYEGSTGYVTRTAE